MKKHLVKTGRRVKGFAWMDPALGACYAFGKPSQSEYLTFHGNDKPLTIEQAVSRVQKA